jgi:hypothetical protein
MALNFVRGFRRIGWVQMAVTKLAIPIFLLFQISCLTQRKTDEELKKRVTELESKIAALHAEQDKDLWQRNKECADRAAIFYKQGKHDDNSKEFSIFYTNHWNKKMGKCFIQINSTSMKDDFVTIDIFDAFEGKQYALYMGHNICDAVFTGNPKTCQLDSGSIWFDGNNTRNPPDYHVGFQGITVGPGVGDKNTQKQFLNHIQPLMTE